MIDLAIAYLSNKLVETNYFDSVFSMAEKIKREEGVYPAIYNLMGEYQNIDLDKENSMCYWRKNGEVTFTSENNPTLATGLQYSIKIPLKLVCFAKKALPYQDLLFADNLAMDIIDTLTITNSELKNQISAKMARMTVKSYDTDSRNVANGEYEKINFTPRYTHAYFSIDFELEVKTNQICNC